MPGGFNPAASILSDAQGVANQLTIGTIQDNLFILGKSYSYEDYLTFGAAGVKTILLDPSLYGGENIVLNPIVVSATSGPIRMDLYTAPTYTAETGTELGVSNRREGMPAPLSKLILDPTLTDPGIRFAGDLVPATGLNPATSSGGANALGLPFEILADRNKAIVITNDDGAGTIVEIKITWFEV